MTFNRDTFFALFREEFGPLTQSQVDGISSLLNAMETDTNVTDIRWLAYMMATVKHECANTWHPIEEYGRGRGLPYGVPNGLGQAYYGRGYVQLTWYENYHKLGVVLDKDLTLHPEEALEPETAYRIMSYGMRNGIFTGKELSDYINDHGCNYVAARRIINGSDKAQLVAGYAEAFERVLLASIAPETNTPPVPATEPPAPSVRPFGSTFGETAIS